MARSPDPCDARGSDPYGDFVFVVVMRPQGLMQSLRTLEQVDHQCAGFCSTSGIISAFPPVSSPLSPTTTSRFVHTHTHTRTLAHLHTRTRTQLHFTRTYVRAHTLFSPLAHVHAHTLLYAITHAHMPAHTHTNTQAHMRTPSLSARCP